jgi:hypothetical protein
VWGEGKHSLRDCPFSDHTYTLRPLDYHQQEDYIQRKLTAFRPITPVFSLLIFSLHDLNDRQPRGRKEQLDRELSIDVETKVHYQILGAICLSIFSLSDLMSLAWADNIEYLIPGHGRRGKW